MPDLTERKLLCRTCGRISGAVAHHWGRFGGPEAHPFDGVPYVPCLKCRGGYVPRGWAFGGVSSWDVCPVCAGTPGWVREEA